MSLENYVSPWILYDYHHSKLDILRTRNRVLKRFGCKTADELKSQLKFSAIFILILAQRIGSLTQMIVDICESKDGSLLGERRSPNDPQVVSVITTNPDFYSPIGFVSPRLGPGAYVHGLASIYKEATGRSLFIEHCGKPNANTFNYAKHILERKAKKRNVKISNFYMIGDNRIIQSRTLLVVTELVGPLFWSKRASGLLIIQKRKIQEVTMEMISQIPLLMLLRISRKL